VTANVSLVDRRLISLMCVQFRISGCGLRSCAMWCIVGVVVLYTNAPFGYFLCQEGSKFKNYFTFRLHIWSTFNKD